MRKSVAILATQRTAELLEEEREALRWQHLLREQVADLAENDRVDDRLGLLVNGERGACRAVADVGLADGNAAGPRRDADVAYGRDEHSQVVVRVRHDELQRAVQPDGALQQVLPHLWQNRVLLHEEAEHCDQVHWLDGGTPRLCFRFAMRRRGARRGLKRGVQELREVRRRTPHREPAAVVLVLGVRENALQERVVGGRRGRVALSVRLGLLVVDRQAEALQEAALHQKAHAVDVGRVLQASGH